MVCKSKNIILLADGSSGNIKLMLDYMANLSTSCKKPNRIILTGKGQDAKIFPALNKLYDNLKHSSKNTDLNFRQDLAYLAVITGPGSFTGLRMTCSMINGFLATTNSVLISPSIYDVLDTKNKTTSVVEGNNVNKRAVDKDSYLLILPASCRKDYFWKLLNYHDKSSHGNCSAEQLWKNYLQPLIDKKLTVIGDDANRFLLDLPYLPKQWNTEKSDTLWMLWQYTKIYLNQQKLSATSKKQENKQIKWAFPFYGRDADISFSLNK